MRPTGPMATETRERPAGTAVSWDLIVEHGHDIHFQGAPSSTRLPLHGPAADRCGPVRARPPRGRLARMVAFIVDGFAYCAVGMHPELFCQEAPQPRLNPDELADDAPRSWRNDPDPAANIIEFNRHRR
jgi:hypothetical protein